ncbi:MAG: FAD-dependent thymidylate synthase [bacterium]|nr:FAD-dependent thymidylate synthase [bacterium]
MEQNPYLKKSDAGLVITDEGHEFLSNLVTDTKGPVYAFTDQAPRLLVAAAMARLSRRGDDFRKIYLDEFATVGPEQAEALIHRVVTAYGDDSVQQLLPIALVVENASNILTKRLEWGRLLAYLEQSTRYIFYDQKNEKGQYCYFVPEHLSETLLARYRGDMDSIFALYSEMVRSITEILRRKIPEPREKQERIAWLGATRAQACDAVRPVLPASTTSTVGIVGSAQGFESMILHLASDPLSECRETGMRILREVRKVARAFFERADLPERGGAFVAYCMDTKEAVQRVIRENLSGITADDSSRLVTLLEYWPKDELELVPEMLFDQTGLPVEELKRIVSGWSREKKIEAFNAYTGERMNRRHRPGRAIEKAHYEWEIVGDYGTFRDLQRHRIVDMWDWQRLTPRYGFDVPALVSESGFEKQFRECFSISQDLYDLIGESGFGEEAQYATLLGQRMRYRFMINARESFHIHELRTGPQGHPGYRKIVQEMHNKLSEVHPLLGKAMKFVNMGEDPELTRLAAERATQKKLALLENKGN